MLRQWSFAMQRRRLRLPRRTIRLRLTALCAALFLASGAGLLAVTYVLVDNHTPVGLSFTGGQAGGQVQLRAVGAETAGIPSQPPGVCLAATGPVATAQPGDVHVKAPATASAKQAKQCAAWVQSQVDAARADYLTSLLTDSGIALGLMALAALGLGWLVSGRVLRPLRTITLKAQQISATNLHERLALSGPDDELKDLGDTMDGLLARLETAFAAQRQFVANASHELRTPLTRQRTMVEVALADPGRSVTSLEVVCRRVLLAGQQQERLIEGLLTLARSQRGVDRLESVDLAAIAREAVLSLSADACRRDIDVTLLDAPATFPGDTQLAERLLTNLLDNAVRHNHRNGRVLVRTHEAAGQAVLSVVNTGPTLDQSEVPGLFEPFCRRGTARTAAAWAGGVGLGLSIVAAIAAVHRADVRAYAQPEGGLDVSVRFCGAGASERHQHDSVCRHSDDRRSPGPHEILVDRGKSRSIRGENMNHADTGPAAS
jgi:signal transduction histidine kinase